MLQILQGCFPRSEELRIFSMLRLQYVLAHPINQGENSLIL